MKKILVFAMALVVGAAYGQSKKSTDYESSDSWGDSFQSGMGTGQGVASDDHMIESNVDSLVRGALSFNKSKTRGSSADNDS